MGYPDLTYTNTLSTCKRYEVAGVVTYLLLCKSIKVLNFTVTEITYMYVQ